MKIGGRQIIAIAAGTIVFIAFMFYLVILSPAIEKRRNLDRNIAKMKSDLAQMQVLKSHWESFERSKAEAEKMLSRRGRDFTLLTHLEEVCGKVGIDTRIQYMKPLEMPDQEGSLKPMGIEMRLSGLDIRQLVQFLQQIEQSRQLLSISRIKIRPSAEEGKRSLEVTLQVNTSMARTG
jgi:type II secretory pathway component PulM